MDKETREARDESIDDWERRARGEDLGNKKCPQCVLGEKRDGRKHVDDKCRHCIIKERTGKVQCYGTPYWNWRDARYTKNTKDQLFYVDQEVTFLKSFLPKEEKKAGIEKGDTVEIRDYSYSFKLEDGNLKPLYSYSISAFDTCIVVATDLKLPVVEGSCSINREQTNDTLLQESTGKYYMFIQKRFLRLVEKKREEKKYCSECGKAK